MAKKEVETFLQGAGNPMEVLRDCQVKAPWNLTPKELQLGSVRSTSQTRGPRIRLCSFVFSALLPCPHDPGITAWGPNGPSSEFWKCCSCPVLALEDVEEGLFLLPKGRSDQKLVVPHIHSPRFTLDHGHTYK